MSAEGEALLTLAEKTLGPVQDGGFNSDDASMGIVLARAYQQVGEFTAYQRQVARAILDRHGVKATSSVGVVTPKRPALDTTKRASGDVAFEVDGERILATTPFALKDLCKSIPGRKWDGEARRWWWPAGPVAAATLVEVFGEYNPTWDQAFDRLARQVSEAQAHKVADEGDLPDIPGISTTPWVHQRRAWAYMQALGPACSLWMEQSVGKSLPAVARAIQIGGDTLVVCPSKVLGVWPREFRRHGAVPVHIENGLRPLKRKPGAMKPLSLDDRLDAFRGLAACDCGRPHVYVVNYQAVWQKALGAWIEGHPWDLVIMDECVPPETMISTPSGQRPIEDLRVGDEVLGVDHETGGIVTTTVLATMCNQRRSPLVEVAGVAMTPKHPVWTDRGYVPAREVRNFDRVYVHDESLPSVQGPPPGGSAEVLQSFLRQDVASTPAPYPPLQLVRTALSPEDGDCLLLLEGLSGEELLGSEILGREGEDPLPLHRVDEHSRSEETEPGVPGFGPQSVSRGRGSTDGSRDAASTGLSSVERREWNGTHQASAIALRATGVANGVHREGEGWGATLLVRPRHSGPQSDAGHRGGWPLPQGEESERTRRPEGASTRPGRVANHPLSERRGDGRPGGDSDAGDVVLNIETGTGNYFAGGLLVHNCQAIKGPQAVSSKHMAKVCRGARNRLQLSGTPMPHTPLDIFAQYRALDPSVFGQAFTPFKQRYARWGGYQDHQYLGMDIEHEDEFWSKAYNLAFRVLAADVLDVPEVMPDTHIEVALTGPQAKTYDDMEADAFAEFPGLSRSQIVEGLVNGTLSAPNAMVKNLRLCQITGGSLKDEVTDRVLEVGSAKADALAEWMEDFPDGQGIGFDGNPQPAEPLVVFCRFRHDLDVVQRTAEAQGRRYGEISGRRNDLTADAEYPEHVDVVGVQIRSGGAGIDLTRACHALYYSVGYSLGDYQQSLFRLHRPGQMRPVRFYYLTAVDTVDGDIWNALGARAEDIAPLNERR